MNDQVGEFYDNWSIEQLSDSDRTRILKWKAVNLAGLFLRTVKDPQISTVCEIGGAEGIILDTVGRILNVERLDNFEISLVFCQRGSKIYPQINFINEEFLKQEREFYDLIICSDILEHIENEKYFLEAVSLKCRYALLKIPLEKCLINSDLWFRLHGKKKPDNQKYGPHNYNGHLRGYTIPEAKSLVKKKI